MHPLRPEHPRLALRWRPRRRGGLALFCALVVVVALCGGVGGLGGVLPRPARRVGVLLLGAVRGLGSVLAGLAGPLRDVRGGLADLVVEIRRLVPSPDVRNGVESGPASQRGLRGALRQQRNSDKHPDKVRFAPIPAVPRA